MIIAVIARGQNRCHHPWFFRIDSSVRSRYEGGMLWIIRTGR